MNWIQAKYDRAFLLLAATFAILGGGVLIVKIMGFNARFEQQAFPKRAEIQEGLGAESSQALEKIKKQFTWKRPQVGVKQPALFVSTAIVQKGEETYDLELEEPKLRPPASNRWLVKHRLNYLQPNVLEKDPDGDGFTNIEEYNAGTNPRDAAIHPELHHKLALRRLIKRDYILQFSGITKPVFQVKRIRPKRKGWFIELNKPFGEKKRFIATHFFEKKETGADGLPNDISELTLLDKQNNETIALKYRQETNIPVYFADLQYGLSSETKLIIRKGKTFQLPGDPQQTSYTFTEVTPEKNIVLSYEKNGEQLNHIIKAP